MSGIAGIVNIDGAPVDRGPLEAMIRCLRPHGPDAQRLFIDGAVGLGHAMLRTTPESASETQPLTLNGLTITADCRIDAREDLVAALTAAGRRLDPDIPDAALVLHAYDSWQERCVDYLLGDFAFALWDAPRRRLVCARDHFGVKPFYYADSRRQLAFSSHLNAVRLAPDVSGTLDELAIADFLVLGYNLDQASTSFASIRRLPPAHMLVLEGPTCRVRRYWQLRPDDNVQYARRWDYIDHFRELLIQATRDRLRCRRVSVMMSGGLDSTSVAEAATRIAADTGAPLEICAHTIVSDRIALDEERKYSQIAATGLGIGIRHYPDDDLGFPPAEPEPAGFPPEPRLLFDASRMMALHRGPAEYARVVLRAEGADALLLATAAAPQRLINDGRAWEVARDYAWLIWTRRQIPYFGARTLLRAALRQPPPERPTPSFPDWLTPDLSRRLHLRDRWEADRGIGFERPGFELEHRYWSATFESVDLGTMGFAAESRYPYLDLRLVRWLMGVPMVPWAMEKSLLRIAMQDRLPAAIVRRRKAPVAGNPWARLLPPASTRWWTPYLTAPELAAYVDVRAADAMLAAVLSAAQARHDRADINRLRSALMPVSLGLWLKQVYHARLGSAHSSVEAPT